MYYGADITEAERLFVHLSDYMELLYIALWSTDILMVLKSPYKKVALYDWDERYPARIHDLYQNIPKGYYTFGEEAPYNTVDEDSVGYVYAIPPQIEQSIYQEASQPHLT